MEWHVQAKMCLFELGPDEARAEYVLPFEDLHPHMRSYWLAMMCGSLSIRIDTISPMEQCEDKILMRCEELGSVDFEMFETLVDALCACRVCEHKVGGPNPVIRQKGVDHKESELLYVCYKCRNINATPVALILQKSPKFLDYLPYFIQPVSDVQEAEEGHETYTDVRVGGKRNHDGDDRFVHEDSDGDAHIVKGYDPEDYPVRWQADSPNTQRLNQFRFPNADQYKRRRLDDF
jgi:hypothetical protein